MIILDTNILWDVTPDSSTADLLRALKAANIQVAVPWVVLEELASHRTLPYVEAHAKAASAINELRRHVPWSGGAPSLDQVNTERHRGHWRNMYQQMVEVIEPDVELLQTALFRESNILAPCKRVGGQKGDKTGSRDAAIWLTAVGYARDHEDEKVYFVSANTKDFGDGTDYPEPMKSDLAGIEDRFFHLTSLDDVVERFAAPAEIDSEFLPALLAREETIELLRDALSEYLPTFASRGDAALLNRGLSYTRLGDDEGAGEVGSAFAWLNPPSLTFEGISDVTAHRIGGHDWYMATVLLFASGFVMLTGPNFTPAANALEARVLVTQDKTGVRPSVLRCKRPRVLTTEEVSRVPTTWTNWQPDPDAPFPLNRLPRHASDKTGSLSQPESSIVLLTVMAGMAIDAFLSRKRAK
ncbi:PIN domain-containing protein [Micromonospora sp. NPDC048871]|uniref:PIN domain-containing protein n=1 Tax=Micromonospora sp. NPDC048871 TaxID=3364259 RepID=UPI00371646C1